MAVSGRRIGPYQLGRELGRGGMGTVFEALDPTLHREVALKLLSAGADAEPMQRARFQREARALARLDHPNIVRVHATGEESGTPYLVMDLVRGGSLQERLDRDGPLPVAEAVDLARKLAGALGHAHDQGIIHRDVKPSNVLVDAAGEPRLTDFGVAKDLASATLLSVPGGVVGTLGYCAPEQGRAGQPVGPPADVFALSATLYHLLTGEPPFAADSVMAVVTRLHEPVVPPSKLRPEVPAALDAVLLKGLATDVAARFPTMAELTAALEGRSSSARRAGSRRVAPTPGPPRAGASRAPLVALAVAAAAGWLGVLVARDRLATARAAADAADARARALEQELGPLRAADARARALEADLAAMRERLVASERARAELEARREPPPPPAPEPPTSPPESPARSPALFDIIARVNRDEFAEAARLLDAHLETRPDDAEALGIRAMCRLNLGQHEGSRADADRALAMGPDLNAFKARAFVLITVGAWAKAAQDLNRLLELRPEDETGLSMRAQCRLRLGDARGGLADAEHFLRVQPDDVVALAVRGLARVRLGSREEGLADLARAVASNPDLGSLWLYRAEARAHVEDLAGALADADRALSLSPRLVDGSWIRGVLRRALGQRPQGLADLREAVQTQPEAGHAWRELALALEEVGDAAGAKDAARKARANGADDDALRRLAR